MYSISRSNNKCLKEDKICWLLHMLRIAYIWVPSVSPSLLFLTIFHFIFEWVIQLDCYTHHTNSTHYRVWRKKPHNHNINNESKHFTVYVSYSCSETALSGPRRHTIYSLCFVVPLISHARLFFIQNFCCGVYSTVGLCVHCKSKLID